MDDCHKHQRRAQNRERLLKPVDRMQKADIEQQNGADEQQQVLDSHAKQDHGLEAVAADVPALSFALRRLILACSYRRCLWWLNWTGDSLCDIQRHDESYKRDN